MMNSVNGGQLLVRALRQAGVETVFGLHGAHIDTIFQACAADGLPVTDLRHEAAAGHAAEGYARTAGRLGVALVTAGGGFTNAVTALANAMLDRTPLLVLAGSGALRDAESNTLQAGFDQVAVARPITKWAHRITCAEHIPRLVAQAIRIATAAPRGPVLLDLPWDVLTEQLDATAIPAASAAALLPAVAPRAELERVLALLREAERPVIIVGSEANQAGVRPALHALARQLGAPVFADTEGFAALAGLPAPLHGGLLQGLQGFPGAGLAPDAVLMLGLRFGLSTGHGGGALIPHAARIVQIDPDAREIGRLQAVELGVVADVAAVITALAEVSAAPARAADLAWAERAQALVQRRYDLVFAQLGQPAAGRPLHPLAASAVVAAHLGEDMVLAADGALSYLWMTEVVSRARPATFLCHGYLGSMGVGFGVALGAQAALQGRGQRCILVTGDGAVGYSLAEFDSAVRHGLPLIVVVMNNRSWGATLHFQQNPGGGRITNTLLENGRYQAVAEAFEADGYFATDAAQLDAALRSALARQRPACINVLVDLDPIPPEERFILGMDPFAEAEAA